MKNKLEQFINDIPIAIDLCRLCEHNCIVNKVTYEKCLICYYYYASQFKAKVNKED